MRATFLILLLSACGEDSNSGKGTIKITSPANNATINATATDPDLSVAFTVSGFTLKQAGTCNGASDCGHVHITIDGTACNDPAAPGPYNADGIASPIIIGFDYCPSISGAHVVVAELHNDDHSYYKPAGTNVVDTIHLTVP